MKLLYACHQFFPDHFTGTERYTLMIARQMQALGHHVEVSTYACRDDGGMRLSPTQGVLWQRYAYQRLPVTAWRLEAHHDSGLDGVSARVGDPALEEAFDDFLGDGAFDVVHVTHPMRQTALLRAAQRSGARTVLTLTDFWTVCPRGTLLRADDSLCSQPRRGRACAGVCYEPKWEELLVERYRRAVELVEGADLVIAPSRFLHGVFRQLGVDTSRFVDRSYSFDLSVLSRKGPSRSRAPDRPFSFGFLGTLLPHKGVDVLVEAFRRLPGADVRLLLYGSSFDKSHYGRRLARLCADDPRIELRGVYDFDRVREVFADIDVVVVPSIWYENSPLVVGISHAAGVPVIATDLGGMTEMVRDGINGLTFRRGDVDDLATKLRAVVDDPDLVTRFARRLEPPPRVERDAMDLAAIYRSLVSGAPIALTTGPFDTPTWETVGCPPPTAEPEP